MSSKTIDVEPRERLLAFAAGWRTVEHDELGDRSWSTTTARWVTSLFLAPVKSSGLRRSAPWPRSAIRRMMLHGRLTLGLSISPTAKAGARLRGEHLLMRVDALVPVARMAEVIGLPATHPSRRCARP